MPSNKTLEVAGGRRYSCEGFVERAGVGEWWLTDPLRAVPAETCRVLDALWTERQKAEGWRLVSRGWESLYRGSSGRGLDMVSEGRRKLAEAGVDL